MILMKIKEQGGRNALKNVVKKVCVIVMLCLVGTMMSGCIGISSIDNMYALPQLSNEYFELQEAIDRIIDSGAEYLAPISGNNRSAVQLVDLDSDGRDEGVACFKVNDEGKQLKIYIFGNSDEKAYAQALVIEGEGTGIESVSYNDMDGDGICEVIVGWQISSELKILCVYSIKNKQATPLIRAEYTTYTTHMLGGDIGGQRGSDVITIKLTNSSESGEVTAYSLMKDGEIVSSTAYLSKGILALSRVRANYLNNGKAAVYIESTTGNSVITDIIVYKKDRLENITLDPDSNVSKMTTRSYSVYSTDINGDGIIEVPRPELLPVQSETTSYYVLKWYTYDDMGERKLSVTTYHNYSDGWYLKIPEDWVGNISVRRADGYSGERVVVFSFVQSDGTFEDFLKIYTLTGENREERAYQAGRFVLLDNNGVDGTIYAAEILESAYDIPLRVTIDIVQSQFKVIYAEWITGEI